MKEILTKDKEHLAIFENGVAINKDLLKWRRAEDRLTPATTVETPTTTNYKIMVPATVTDRDGTTGRAIVTNDGQFIEVNSPVVVASYTNESDPDSQIDRSGRYTELFETPEGLAFDEIAAASIKDLNRLLVEKKIKYVMAGFGSFGSTVTTPYFNTLESNDNWGFVKDNKKEEKKPLLARLFGFKTKEERAKAKEEANLMDALKFFSLIKATSKESAETYRDRVSGYLKALYNASVVGQTALQEELLRGLVANKYESLLFAEGLYYVVTEEQVVEFAKKSEKGITLDYLKNFSRPLPFNVSEKIKAVNELEVFDNYVVLYYDPEGKIYKETAKEKAKRKDPILFGVIAGSNKLYYIADWIDESCDLTLDKFIDTLHITKDSLHMDYDPKKGNVDGEEKENKGEEKKKKTPRKKKKD